MVDLKKIAEQVVVITGASSGIGLATAKMAARKGAKVVLGSRNEDALRNICNEIRESGGEADYCAGDVADVGYLENLADVAVKRFGRIDTWFNNAGVLIVGRLEDTSLAEKRRLFDVNFWGVVHGCRAALPHLKRNGGALINMGSIESERAMPLHGIYSASKHAIKAYTDTLRMELAEEDAPVSVTLIKPASIDTDIITHARIKLGTGAKNPSPIYSPEIVAASVIHCAENETRDLLVGGSAKFYSLLEKYAPHFTDKLAAGSLFKVIPEENIQMSNKNDALFAIPKVDGRERGNEERLVHKTSLYTTMARHPRLSALAAGVVGSLVLGRFINGKSLHV